MSIPERPFFTGAPGVDVYTYLTSIDTRSTYLLGVFPNVQIYASRMVSTDRTAAAALL